MGMEKKESGALYPAKRLEAFGASVLAALGLPEQDAVLCAARMIDADLRGVDTHGIFRINHYSQRIKAGGINLRPRVHTVRENAVTALANG